ncbi:MAG: V-type ATP synthase subunit D [Planctomycetaceae bacterium]|nr:V-type ATP synthase subunit D [Planctomycetaceae bacterium]
MAQKVKLTRPELKRQRDALTRFERYLPMLKLKQQQLQSTVQQVQRKTIEAQRDAEAAQQSFDRYSAVLADRAGVNVTALAEPSQVKTTTANIAGVTIPVFQGVEFAAADYSLFTTPAWVDRAVADLRSISSLRARAEILHRQQILLQRELLKIIQRVNLFEKVKIPRTREIIRVIRIKLGDEMTAAVGRAKIAKTKLSESDFHTAAEPAEPEAPAQATTEGTP